MKNLCRRWRRDREEVRTTSSTALGVCRNLCRRWKRDREGERRYEPRESTSRRGKESLIERRGHMNLGNPRVEGDKREREIGREGEREGERLID